MLSNPSLALASTPRRRRLSVPTRQALLDLALRASDVAAISATAALAAGWPSTGTEVPIIGLTVLACFLAGQIFTSFDLYALRHRIAGFPAVRLILGWSITLLGTLAFAGLTGLLDGIDIQRWGLRWFLGGAALLTAVRLIWVAALSRAEAGQAMIRRVAVIGTAESLASTLALLGRSPKAGMEVVTAIEVGADWSASVLRPEVLADLEERITAGSIERVLIALPEASAHAFDQVVRALEHLPVDIDWVPQMPNRGEPPRLGRGGAPISTLPLQRRPIDGIHYVVKTIEDRVLGGAALLFLAPLMLLLALAVKLTSKGPIFYRQLRHGFNHELISVLKFRTMYVQSCDAAASTSIRQATRGDPRVTPLGRFLRRTSLDELPQLINVLRGDMSLVGPRPHPLALNQHYLARIDGYLGRHRVKPGITGWAQINGCRGETVDDDAMARRIAYDLHYIESWSLFFDLHILWLTLLRGFVNTNAY